MCFSGELLNPDSLQSLLFCVVMSKAYIIGCEDVQGNGPSPLRSRASLGIDGSYPWTGVNYFSGGRHTVRASQNVSEQEVRTILYNDQHRDASRRSP